LDGNIEPRDMVRLMSITPDVCDCEQLETRTLFESLPGMSFLVMAVENVEGLPTPLVRLER
jgi:hypothetical protein